MILCGFLFLAQMSLSISGEDRLTNQLLLLLVNSLPGA